MYNLAEFSLQDMTACSSRLRTLGADSAGMDETAGRITRFLYEHLRDGQTGQPACALIRLFTTRPYGTLSAECRASVQHAMGPYPTSPEMKCLVLAATSGAQPEWNHPEQSQHYKAISLASDEFVAQFPMFSQLFIQLGIKLDTASQSGPDVLVDAKEHTFNVFYVAEAKESPFVPVQEGFVLRYGIRSVLGFGGRLPSGNLFVVVLFSKIFLPRQAAELFKTLALSVNVALLPYDSLSEGDGAIQSRRDSVRARQREAQIAALEQLLTVHEEVVTTYAAQRRHAEAALQDSEDRLRAIVHSTKDVVLFVDRQGFIKSWNQGAQALFGYSVQETYGQSIDFIMAAELKAVFAQSVRDAEKLPVHQTTSVTCESTGRRKDGTTFPLELSLTAWKTRPAIIILATIRDVTDRKRVEAALEKSESHLRNLFDHAPDVMFTLSTDGVITSLNPVFETMSHWPRSEWIGQAAQKLVHPDDVKTAQELFTYIIRKQCPMTCVVRIRSRDRGHRTLEVVGTPFVEGSQVVGLLGMARDITERKIVETALRESEAQLRSVVQSTQDAIISLDRKGTVIFWNTGAERMFGYAVEEMLNRPVTCIIPERFREAHQRGIERAAAAGRLTVSATMFELIGLRKDGTEFPLEFTLASWSGESGIFFTGIIRDIAERKRAENELTALLQGTASVTGREFFSVLVRELAVALGGRYTAVAEIVSEEPMRFRVLASWEDGRPGVPFEYEAAETPCETAIRYPAGYYTDRVQDAFPHDRYLRRHRVNAFLAVPLMNSSGQPIGCLRVMDAEPLKNEQHARTIANIFAARAAAELERLRATAALHESEARQALILNALPIAFYTAEVSGDFAATWVSDNLERLTGFAPRKFLEDPGFWAGRLHPEDRARVLASMAQGRLGGTVTTEYRWQTADGSYRWFLDNAVYVRNEEGRPKELIGAWIDITRRREAEHALRDSEERLRLALSATHLGIWDWDIGSGQVVWSETVAPIFGLPLETMAVTYESYLNTIHADDRRRVMDAVTLAVEGRSPYAVEHRVVWPDGTLRWVSCKGEVLCAGGGKARMLGTVQDITERKDREAELHSVLARVRTLSGRLEVIREEERGRIARELHDEFGVGLTCLKIDLSRLLSLIGTTLGLEKGRQIEEKIRSMDEFIDTTIGGVQRLVSELRPAILDDLGLVAAMEWQAQDFQRRTGITCTLRVDEERLDIDSDRATVVFRICQEALTNVVRHAKATAVSIRLEEAGGRLTLEVMDNGQGIPTEKIADSQSLGLLGMRERAELFGGVVTIAGCSGGGTVVTLHLQCAQARPGK